MPKRDRPDDDAVAFFMRILESHAKIGSFDRISHQKFEIRLRAGTAIIAYLTDIYTIGMADYLRIRRDHPDVNCIVTASGYNSYTQDAKTYGKSEEVGIFKIGEFMGALHRADIWNYGPPEKRRPTELVRERGA